MAIEIRPRPCPQCTYPLDVHVTRTIFEEETELREYCHGCGYGQRRKLTGKKNDGKS